MSQRVASAILGAIYFTTWSLSFYPQPLKNLSRRSVSGTSPAYPLANLLGFASYASYTSALLFSATIRAQYGARHPSAPVPAVSAWDFAFAAHAVAIIAVTLAQYLVWGGAGGHAAGQDVRGSGLSRAAFWWVAGACVAGVAYILLAIGLVLATAVGMWDVLGHWEWLDVIYALSQVKLFLTLVKYTPQAVLNFRRKSTEGWSIGQVLLDFPGGLASMAQLLVDSSAAGVGWREGVGGNVMKLLLALYSMAFDVVFMTQHFILYPPRKRDEPDDERRPLLA